MAAPKILMMMADYGHEPTETAVPYSHFKNAGFEVQFVTENGKSPECDKKLCEGVIQKLLGAKKTTLELYKAMKDSPECQHPLSWTAEGFTLDDFDAVYLPGGHEKSVRQIIDSKIIHRLLADYFPKTRRPAPDQPAEKTVVAVCHGVQILANSKREDGHSVLYDVDTTSLPAKFEQVAFWGTRAFMGDYYKTYGKGSLDVEVAVRKALKDDKKQYKSSLGMRPFIVEDKVYQYISGRFPNDVDLLSEVAIKMVRNSCSSSQQSTPQAAVSPESQAVSSPSTAFHITPPAEGSKEPETKDDVAV